MRDHLDGFTVVIPTLGRDSLASCLQSVVSGTVLPGRMVVIDQGNNPAIAAWLDGVRELGIEVNHVFAERRGVAAARNRGLAHVETRFMAGIDDDCVADENWLAVLARQLVDTPDAVVTGRVNAGDHAGYTPATVTSPRPEVFRRPSIRTSSHVASGNMGFSMAVARRIGPFDPHLPAAEDNDWGYRALRAGIPIVYNPEMIVTHLDWRDKSQLMAVYRTYAWGQGAFYGKHLCRGDWSMLPRVAIHLWRGARAWAQGALRGDYERYADGATRLTRVLPGVLAGCRCSLGESGRADELSEGGDDATSPNEVK